MAATTQNPAVRSESKSAKKKKSKPEPSVEAVAAPAEATPAESNDGTYESPYIKELYKYAPLPCQSCADMDFVNYSNAVTGLELGHPWGIGQFASRSLLSRPRTLNDRALNDSPV